MKEHIKDWLLEGYSRVYTIIVDTYIKDLTIMGPTLFSKYLAKELSIPEEKINVSSINSALVRRRKKTQKGKNNMLDINESIQSTPSIDFKFSSGNTLPKKNGLTEL